MLRESKLPRRNLNKSEEIENLDPSESSSAAATNPRCIEAPRPPLNTIQDIERTPSKATKRKGGPELRTPERSLNLKPRFAWPQRSDTVLTTFDDRRGSGVGNATPRGNRMAVRACSESNSTQSTPTKSVTKPPVSSMSVRGKGDGSSFSVRLGNYGGLYKGVSSTPVVVNSVEVPHFDLKEDSSFWINHNVQVIIRVRPLNSMERSIHSYNRCLKQDSSQSISWIGQPENRFTFDHVACETVDQEMIFRMAGLPMVENCLSGYNSCMFAYGQTGSGKTYTMLGEIEDLDVKPSPHRGMTPRIFEFLFARIQAEEESRRDENLKYNCKCSFLEIYNEQITDLLDPSSTNLLLREDVKKGVYVENLSEFEAQSVSDIIRLLIQGSANRKVAATNMNRESSRSHCVFTCVIESTWEKDSTTNYRFARLNLVDLAGSERQKTSGAEGERLKEAANINKSLSTLGHVIMILVDVANGKQRHIPYRDSRLTFLLQDSLGGNSKTMIIANVSPSICCAAETLNTLKFAQRAKLIQNNAVVNEDSSGDVIALKLQIRLLKEEISTLKRCQNVSRSLSFKAITQSVDQGCFENEPDMEEQHDDDMIDYESKGTRMSHKQLESLETTLAGGLRREQIAETSIRQLEAEIELLNSLVRQREEETMSCKMMLRFREDKIRRLESRVVGSITADQFLQEDNKALSDEIQLLQGKIDQNPEVTRFAKENIRLQEQLRRYEEFYGEGEREILLSEVSSLREQLLQFLERNSVQGDLNYGTQPQKTQCCNKQNESVDLELRSALDKLEECRNNLNSCLEENARLKRELDSFHSMFNNTTATKNSIKGPLSEAQSLQPQTALKHEPQLLKHTDDILDLHLELDVIKIILKEERTARGILEEQATSLNHEILMANKHLEEASNELEVTKTVIEALESQQVLSIKEIEDMQNKNNYYLELVRKQEREITALKNQLAPNDLRDSLSSNHPKIDNEYPLQVRFRRMHDSLEKAKQLNMFYQSDRALQISNEEEMDEVRRQAEAETAEVIVCMQEELAQLQHQVNDSHQKEIEMKESMLRLETELKGVQEKLLTTVDDNQSLSEELWQRDTELKSLAEECELLTSEIEEILSDGCQALDDASDVLGHISNSFSQKRIWISEQVGMMVRKIAEKELLIEELGRCLEDASNKRSDMESMLKSLRSATLVITEAHQKELDEAEKEILLLTSQLSEKTSTVEQMEEQLILAEDQIRKTSKCATVAFVVVNRLSDVNRGYLVDLKHKDILLGELGEIRDRKDTLLIDQSTSLEQAERQIAELQEECDKLLQKLSEEKEHSYALEQKLEDIEKNVISETREQLILAEDQIRKTSKCATVAFVVVNRLSDVNRGYLVDLKHKDILLGELGEIGDRKDALLIDQSTSLEQAERQIAELQEQCGKLLQKLSEEKEHSYALEQKLEDIEKNVISETREQLILTENQIRKTSKCATVAFVVVNRLSDVNRGYLVDLKHKDILLGELGEISDRKDALLIDQSTSLEQAERQIAELQEECDKLLQKLSEEKEQSYALEQKLEDIEKNVISETREQLITLQDGVSSIRSSMASFADNSECLDNRNLLDVCTSNYDDNGESTTSSETHHQIDEMADSTVKLAKSGYRKSRNVSKDAQERDVTITLLRKEIECALESLKEVQDEIAKLHAEKKEMSICEKQSRESIKCLTTQILDLQAALGHFEKQSKVKVEVLSCKLINLETTLKEAMSHWNQTKELLELEVGEAKIVQVQKSEEAHCILAKFEEAQATIEEADFMINELVMANEKLKEREVMLLSEKDILFNKVESLQTVVDSKDQEIDDIVESNLIETRDLVMKVDDVIEDVQLMMKENSMSLACDIECFKSHFLCSTKLIQPWLEKIWSEIISKDCAMSVLHLCHIGGLLETVTGMHAENGLLSHGLCESNSVISDLKEQNFRMWQELEMCRIFKGKLLADIQKSFDQITRKEVEAGEMIIKLRTFAKSLSDLQLQEEMLLQRSNEMGSQLAMLTREFDLSNTDAVISLLDQEKLLKQKVEASESQAEFFMVDWYAKDFELLVHASEFRSMAYNISDMEKRLLDKIQDLEVDYDKVIGDIISKDVAFEFSFNQMFFLEDQIRELKCTNCMLDNSCCNLKNELHLRDSEITRIQSLLQLELSRKEDVIKGLLYDLSLLQESAANSKDRKDEMEEMKATMEALESELTVKSGELAAVVANCQLLEAKLMDESNRVTALELDLSKEREVVKLQVSENHELKNHIEDALVARKLAEEELKDRMKITNSLEDEILEMSSVLGQMNDSIKNLSVDRDALTIQRDQLQGQVNSLKERFEKAAAQAEATEAIAQDAQKLADARKVYAEEREAEVELLERSVEELESTVNVLESNVDFIKGEAERQRLQREDLEMELCSLKDQMQNLRNADDDIKRFLDEKEKSLEEALNHIQVLKSDIAGKDAEVAQMKAHISELNLHAEAQAMEDKQKFKALEAMAEQFKPEGLSTQSSNALSNKSEKNATKSRGSGSPFKCIGLGLAQQVKYEKVEELSAARLRIEELESQAACRQKEIFSLNARLAAAESMTHDVIRDLLGVKLDMTTYVSLLDNHQGQKIAEKAQFLTLEPQEKEQEVTKLKKQLNEFIEERKGWLQDIDRKQAELVAAQIALEKLRQRNQLLKTENELLRMENASIKSKVMELEGEMNKLSGQQNLQQRIHHHAKIKEENNTLKIQNEQLSAKLRKANKFISRVEEYIPRLRASAGSKEYIDFDEEERLRKMLKEIEEEKVQLAQQLLRLSINVLKAAGIAKPMSDVNPSIAEEALEELKNRITSLEMEQENLKFKNKIMKEKIRLSELMPQASPLSSKSEENRITPRAGRAPLLSSFER